MPKADKLPPLGGTNLKIDRIETVTKSKKQWPYNPTKTTVKENVALGKRNSMDVSSKQRGLMSRRSNGSRQPTAPTKDNEGLLIESLHNGIASAQSNYINPAAANKKLFSEEAHLDIRSKMRAGTGVVFSEGQNILNRGMAYEE